MFLFPLIFRPSVIVTIFFRDGQVGIVRRPLFTRRVHRYKAAQYRRHGIRRWRNAWNNDDRERTGDGSRSASRTRMLDTRFAVLIRDKRGRVVNNDATTRRKHHLAGFGRRINCRRNFTPGAEPCERVPARPRVRVYAVWPGERNSSRAQYTAIPARFQKRYLWADSRAGHPDCSAWLLPWPRNAPLRSRAHAKDNQFFNYRMHKRNRIP